jgi:cell division protein FtsW
VSLRPAGAGSAGTGLGDQRAWPDDEDDAAPAVAASATGRRARRPGAGAGVAGLRDGARRLKALLDRPLASYYLVVGCALLLLGVGLMMVLSTSTAYDLDQGLPPYSMFEKQLLGAAAGLLLMWLAAKSPPRVFRAFAYPMLLAAIGGLVLVLLLGHEVDGAKRWLNVAGTQVQPSEFAKLALVVWGADLLARKERLSQLADWRHILVPLLPGAGLMCLLVMIGKDLGTTFLLSVIFLSLLWVIGAPGRLIVGMVTLMAFSLLLLVAVHPYEWARISGFLSSQSPRCRSLTCYQLVQGKDALGSGGLFGVGSGASRGKWGAVPNSPTDWIFAILGEELGLVGTLCVVVLYGGLAFAGLRISRRVPDTFSRLCAGAITVWLTAQALVNMGAVLGLLPITGVPLPLISAGVSSLIVTMVAIGMLMSFARSEPGAAQAPLRRRRARRGRPG